MQAHFPVGLVALNGVVSVVRCRRPFVVNGLKGLLLFVDGTGRVDGLTNERPDVAISRSVACALS